LQIAAILKSPHSALLTNVTFLLLVDLTEISVPLISDEPYSEDHEKEKLISLTKKSTLWQTFEVSLENPTHTHENKLTNLMSEFGIKKVASLCMYHSLWLSCAARCVE